MNKLFTKGILDIDVPVHGETKDYTVKISFARFLDILQRYMRNNNDEFALRFVIKSLVEAFNQDNVYIHCTCEDWCLHPDTQIKLLSGEVVTVEEMCKMFNEGKKLWVYSTDDKGDFVPGEVENVWITKHTNEFIKVTLDNNEEILTTPEHLYRLRDGSYIEANKLVKGTSLMPLYFSYSNGYENVKCNSQVFPTKFTSVYKKVADCCLQKEIDEAKIRSGENIIQIHHRDFNKNNNTPENLSPMGQLEHWKYHYEHLIESGCLEKFLEGGKKYWQTQEAKEKQSKVMRDVMNNYYSNISQEDYQKIKDKIYTDEWRNKIGQSNKKVWENYSKEEYEQRCENHRQATINNSEKIGQKVHQAWERLTDEEKELRHKKSGEGVKRSWKEHPEKYMTQKRKESDKLKGQYIRTSESTYKCNITKISNIIQNILSNNEIPSPETYNKYKKNGYPNYTKCFETWEELSNYFALNHKIKDIEYVCLDEKIPVYDIQVKDYSNFMVNAGVILHNCYRMAYWATKNDINSGEKQFSNGKWIRNPNDDLGPGCKHTLLVINNTAFLIKVASVITNYVKYMEKNYQQAYADKMYPRIFGKEYEGDVQLSMQGLDDANTKADIDAANIEARKRGQWQKGNEYRFTKDETPIDSEQQSFGNNIYDTGEEE